MSHTNNKRKFEETIDYYSDICWGTTESTKSFKSSECDTTKSQLSLTNQVYTIGHEIHFTCGINKHTIQEIIRQITQIIHDHLKNSSHEPEKLNIVYIVDSPGGSVTSVLKFVDFLDMIRKKHTFITFTSIISGMAASAGTTMSIVADNRYMSKNAHAMIHELSSGASSKYTELLSYVKFLKKLHNRLVDIYCDKTGKDRDAIEKLLRNETWFSAKQYKKHGFITEIK